MTRRHLTFLCEGDRLAATLDEGEQETGLLLVTGGNEIRSGAFSGQAAL
ncbi:MAG: hydrolase 1, exosortase A system-associated, partial [Erythrobacter sp.]|nr:hydrolase 1, exosortase A system-associated [Erythrobacter sp.]